ncbi:MAG: hypothetical protein CFE43_17545 [Burkholderiales bacterium PBB3]|nr:MAG: hypothetical protein CFE43_17545 [Burkholderiales bacterium PBB3]
MKVVHDFVEFSFVFNFKGSLIFAKVLPRDVLWKLEFVRCIFKTTVINGSILVFVWTLTVVSNTPSHRWFNHTHLCVENRIALNFEKSNKRMSWIDFVPVRLGIWPRDI